GADGLWGCGAPDPGAVPGRQEGRGRRRGADEARRTDLADRAGGEDPPRPRGLARRGRDVATDRRQPAAAAPGGGDRAGMRMPASPLAGVRVVETGTGAGEHCGRLFADLGAEVIKVEPPEGAASRAQAPLHEGVSVPFAI